MTRRRLVAILAHVDRLPRPRERAGRLRRCRLDEALLDGILRATRKERPQVDTTTS